MMWSNAHKSNQDTTDAMRDAPHHSMLSWLHVPGRDLGLGHASACLEIMFHNHSAQLAILLFYIF